MSWNGFGELDLSGVEASAGSARLGEGSYRVKCTDAQVAGRDGSSNRAVVITLVDEDGHGDIRVNFNVNHTSKQAQEIGLGQLKGFLTVAGHPNPDRPGDIKSLIGLRCVINVGMGKPWTDNEGKQRQNTEVKKFSTVDTPVSGPAKSSAAKSATQAAYDAQSPNNIQDEIPF